MYITLTCFHSLLSSIFFQKKRRITMGYFSLILGSIAVILISRLRKYVDLIWKTYIITKNLKKQGVAGPDYKFLKDNTEEINELKKGAYVIELDINSHDYSSRVVPHYFKWVNQYGGIFLYWVGSTPTLCVTDPELVKQVLSNKFGFFTKPIAGAQFDEILGKQGLVLVNGKVWATHRRIISPAFTMDKLKVMTKEMAMCTNSMLDKWHEEILRFDAQNDSIDVHPHFNEVTADIISHSAFGSSYAEGKDVFLTQRELIMMFLTATSSKIPGVNYLPTKRNQQRWKLEKEMKETLMKIIKTRLDSTDSNYGHDLLGLMIEENQKEGGGMTIDEIIDECKTFFFAGHETTANLLTWTMFLLSTNLGWQDRLRKEVVEECGMEIPNADNLTKFKLVTMVLYEALRLYDPVIFIARNVQQEVNIGKYKIPKGSAIVVPFAVIHRKEELWGENADEFDPLRFENGVTSAAKHPSAMLAFSVGPRSCVGQNFAMMEAKIVIAMILQRFEFSLSPKYKHMPAEMLTLQPQNGLPLVIKPLLT